MKINIMRSAIAKRLHTPDLEVGSLFSNTKHYRNITRDMLM